MKRFVLSALVLGSLSLPPALLGAALAEDPKPPAQAPSAEQILGWVNDLGSDDFRTREQASRHLAAAGEASREALTTAVKTSDSLEVRWRAQQLLMRLDGKAERSVEPENKPGQPRAGEPGSARAGQPGALDERWRRLFEADDPQKLQKLLDEMFQGLPGRGPWRGFDVAPFGVWGDFALGARITAGDLTLKRGLMGMGPWVLEVRKDDASGRDARAVYSGESLEAILEAHPELKDHPSLADLKARLAEHAKREQPFPVTPPGSTWRGRLGGPGAHGFTFKSSQGVEIRQDADGAVVRLHETGPDGQPVVKEYRGESLEAIQREHPELAGKLGGVQLRLGPPRVFRGPREEPLPPVAPPEPMPVPVPEPAGPRFGVLLDGIEPALAAHLKLEAGRGVLVAEVLPGSQAAAIGLKVFDVIEAVNGQPLRAESAPQQLREAARSQGPLSLGVIRDGARLTLSR